MDAFVGTAGNDTFNAPTTDGATPVKTLGGLDNIDGGDGVDTLNVDDTATGTGVAFAIGTATIKNVENVNIATTGTLGAAATALDLSGLAGAAKFDLKSQDTGAVSHAVKVADTADLSIVAGAGTVDTVGGKVVSVAAPGVVTVKGDALTAVTVKGAASTSTVENTVAGAGVAGTTLKSVTFDAVDGVGATATAKGDALESLTLKNLDAALAVALTNTATESLTVNVENAGYNTTTKALVGGVAVDASTAANYKTVTVNSTGVNQLALTAAGATTIKATGAGNVTLALTAGAATAFDGSAATGDIALSGFATTMTDIKTGAGKDSFTTNQTTKSTFDTGAGNDTVTVASALAAGTDVKLGAGDDKLLFSTGGSVANSTATATTVVDGGDGSDTLALALVGAANVGVFQNFEVFDVLAMANGAKLDMDILASKNTVTALTGSGALGGAAVELLNVGAGVNFTAVAAMGNTNVLTLTQKTAGALTVTLDVDSTKTDNNGGAGWDSATDVKASNATSLKAVFDNSNAFEQTATIKNDALIELEGTKATSLEVVSGGANSTNALTYVYGKGTATANPDGLLTSVTVSGSQALTLAFSDGTNDVESNIATIDASALTGSLTVDLADLKNGGTVKLGSGADVVKAGGVITTSADIESVENFTKAASNAADAVKVADILDFTTAATVAADATVAGNLTVSKGVATFLGAGPTTLDAALVLIDANVGVAGTSVAFEYIGNTYVFQAGGAAASGIADDYVVKLTGVTGVTELGVSGGDLFIV